MYDALKKAVLDPAKIFFTSATGKGQHVVVYDTTFFPASDCQKLADIASALVSSNIASNIGFVLVSSSGSDQEPKMCIVSYAPVVLNGGNFDGRIESAKWIDSTVEKIKAENLITPAVKGL